MTSILSLEWAMLRGWRGAFLVGMLGCVLARAITGPLPESVAQVVLWLLPAAFAVMSVREMQTLRGLTPRLGDWPLRPGALAAGHLFVWVPIGIAIGATATWLLFGSAYARDARQALTIGGALVAVAVGTLLLVTGVDVHHAGRPSRLASIGFRVLAGLWLLQYLDEIAQGEPLGRWWSMPLLMLAVVLIGAVTRVRGRGKPVEFLPTPSPKPVLPPGSRRGTRNDAARPERWWRRRDPEGMRKARATRARPPWRTLAKVTGSAPVWGFALALLVVSVLVLSDATGEGALAVILLYTFALAHVAVGYALRAWSWLRTSPIEPGRVTFTNQLPVLLVFSLLVFAAFYASYLRVGSHRGPTSFATTAPMRPYVERYADRPADMPVPGDGGWIVYPSELIHDEPDYFVRSTRWLYRNWYGYEVDPDVARSCLGRPGRFQDYPKPYEAYPQRLKPKNDLVFRWILRRAHVIPRRYLPIRSPADLVPLKSSGEVYDLAAAQACLWREVRGGVRLATLLSGVLHLLVWLVVTLASITVFLRPSPLRWLGPILGGGLLFLWIASTWHPVTRSIYAWHVAHAWITIPAAALVIYVLGRTAARGLLDRPPTAPSPGR